MKRVNEEKNVNEEKKKVNDPIHGLILLPRNLFNIIDTPEFQRLRDIKQLGGMYFVFPGAVHNRFEHCLGTAYLAREWLKHLLNNSSSHWKEMVTQREEFLLQVAGLCHDLGHGPFSHTFEKCFVKHLPNGFDKEWDHENLSCKILKIINNNSNPKLLTEDELTKIDHMIKGTYPKDDKKKFLYQIVHNNKCEVDADKFDYLQRDCHGARLPLGVDCDRIIKTSSISDGGDITFPIKESYNLVQLFSSRYALHKQVYTHPVVQAIELMIGDILKKSSEANDISKYLNDHPNQESLKWYIGLTDSILREIERKDNPPNEMVLLRKRKIYKKVMDYVMEEKTNKDEVENFLRELTNICGQWGHVLVVKRNWCKGEKNPLEDVYPFEPLEAIDTLLPNKFQEVIIRVFAIDADIVEKVKADIQELLGKHKEFDSLIASPKRPKEKPPKLLY